MRARRGFASSWIMAVAIAFFALAWDGQPRRDLPQHNQTRREQRQAPLPVAAWAALAVLGGIAAARHTRRPDKA